MIELTLEGVTLSYEIACRTCHLQTSLAIYACDPEHVLKPGTGLFRPRHHCSGHAFRGGPNVRSADQGYGRGGTPIFSGVFEPLSRVAPYPTDEDGLGTCFGAA